jgi:phosphoenolpyruvate carboxykinase (ATP)
MNNILNIKTPAENQAGSVQSDYGLDNIGLVNLRKIYWNLSTEALYEEIIFRGEAQISQLGPIIVNTGKHTARAANDKLCSNPQPSEMYGGANITDHTHRKN